MYEDDPMMRSIRPDLVALSVDGETEEEAEARRERFSPESLRKVQREMDTFSLLSIEALTWLKSVGYSDKSHEEREVLIHAARIAYPD